MKTYFIYDTDIGKITIECTDNVLSRLSFGEQTMEQADYQRTSFSDEVYCQITEYLSGVRRTFTLPLCPQGTVFQKRVWDALCTIGYGQTCSYSDIAAKIGSPRASRAVGGANHRNPIAIIIPCHRVIGKNGALTGYAGGMDIKRYLLELEQKNTQTLSDNAVK